MFGFVKRVALIVGVVAVTMLALGPRTANADVIGGTSTQGCVTGQSIVWQGSLVGFSSFRPQFRLHLEGPVVVSARWEYSNGWLGPSKQWYAGAGETWDSVYGFAAAPPALIATFQAGSSATAKLVFQSVDHSHYTGCYAVTQVAVSRTPTGAGGGLPPGSTPPPDGGGPVAPTPTPSGEATPTPDPTPDSCASELPMPSDCEPPEGYCWGYGPPAPGTSWPIMECEAPPSPSPTPTPTPEPPTYQCTYTAYPSCQDTDPVFEDLEEGDIITYSIEVTKPGGAPSGAFVTVKLWTGGVNPAAGFLTADDGSGQFGREDSHYVGTSRNVSVPGDGPLNGITVSDPDGWGAYPTQVDVWIEDITRAGTSILPPPASPSPTPPTPTPTPPADWEESPQPGQDGDGDGFRDEWGAPEGGDGGSDGIPTTTGGNTGAGAACEGKPVEEKIGFQAYDEVPDLDSLALRVEGKDALAGLGEALGWLGDMVWTLPNRIGNVAKWVWNTSVSWFVPDEECLQGLIEAFVDDVGGHVPFSWIADAREAIDAGLGSVDAGDTLPTTITYMGKTVQVGGAMDAVTDFFVPYRSWLEVLVYLGFGWFVFNEALNFFGRRSQPKQLELDLKW